MPIAAHPAAERPEGEQQDDGQAVLVFGATGQQGRATAKALRSRGGRVRAMVRNPASPKALELSTLGVELFPGDLADIASIRRAMTGVHGVFSVQPNSGQDPAGGLTDQDEVRYAADIAQVAVEQNVQHLVYSSTILLSRGATGVANLDVKLEIEAHLRALPLRSTIVRPGTFMELLLQPGLAPRGDVFTFFVEPHQTAQLIAVDDIGKIVAGILAAPNQFAGQAINIAGDAPSGREIGQALSRAAGRPIRYQKFPDAALAEAPALARTIAAFEPGRSESADIPQLQRAFGPLLTLDAWLKGPGKPLLDAALAAPPA